MSDTSVLEATQTASTFVIGVVQVALDAIRRGDVELGSSLLEGVRPGIEEPSLVDTWKALALIQAGDARAALVALGNSHDDFGWVRDRREATRALAMRSLNMPGWQPIADRILASSGDPIAREMAARIDAWQ